MDVEQAETAQKTAFSVNFRVYSGPLDLLIDLIEKRKLLINDISLATVTDEYMAYVVELERNPLNDMADFIVLASTLLLLKSKSLLPVLELTEAEEESVDTLEKRLRYYQIYRNAGRTLSAQFGRNISFESQFAPQREPLFLTDSFTTVHGLGSAMRAVLTQLPQKQLRPKVQVRTVVSLETMIDRLKRRIEQQFRFNFNEFAGDEVERTSVIVGFLAVLELVKQGTVLVRQNARFHEIEIERTETLAPRYD